MPADSSVRRLVKRLARPLFNDSTYSWIQAVAAARDIRSGALSEPEIDLVAAGVREGEHVVDVGANLGMYLPALSRAVGPAGVVFAFEPVPFTASTLTKVVRLLRLRNTRVLRKGCSDRGGSVVFEVPVQSSGALSTGQAYLQGRRDQRPGAQQHVRWSAVRPVEAEVVRLDDYLPAEGEVSLIKCDVEGVELLVFRGAAGRIDRDRPSVICEINPWFLDGFEFDLGELTGFFSDRGYELYRYDDANRTLSLVKRPEDVVEDNYVFIHPRRLERFTALLAQREAS